MGFGHFPLFKQLLLSLSTALKEQQEIEEFFLKEFGHFPLSKQIARFFRGRNFFARDLVIFPFL